MECGRIRVGASLTCKREVQKHESQTKIPVPTAVDEFVDAESMNVSSKSGTLRETSDATHVMGRINALGKSLLIS